ncbi:MAG: type restriction enzyme subunit [Blastocatellia bacterium]|jgi:type I restriction enzyme S subunit|nr:type restriction enzyme subunit [Blastocatellia bacterium]
MELKPGYKQTELGTIPEDWETPTILELARQIIDFRGRTPRKLGMEWGGGDIPALSAGNVKMGYIDLSEQCYFGSEALYKRWMTKGDIAKDDIVFTTEAPLGNVALVPDNRKYILSQRTILIQVDSREASSRFFFQQMMSARFQKLLADHSSGSTAKGIQRKKFERLKLARPSEPEQRAIAEALSDADALLRGLDRLIAKKRDLKQAAMQQLLSGRTRLPEFHGSWEVKRIDKLASFQRGFDLPTSKLQKGHHPVVYSNGVQNHHATFMVRGPGVVTGRSGTIGKVHFVEQDFWPHNTTLWVTDFKGNDRRFVYYFLTRIGLERFGTGSGVPTLNRNDVHEFLVRVPPSSSAEQSTIAEVLSDMDAELAALEQRREKTRALKQAMMQELLTGRTRLI